MSKHPDCEPGKYRARGTTGALGMTSTGKEQIGIELVFLGGQYDATRITWYGYFTEATVDRTLDSMRYLGWKGDSLLDLAGLDANEVEIVIEDETDDKGEVRSRVKWINRLGGPALKKQLTQAEATAFAARMKGAIVAHGKKASAPRTAAPTRRSDNDGPPPNDDSDLGF